MIEVVGLSKRFGEQQVLRGIGATFEKGVVNQVIGRSGSGKSVLAKCIVGLHTPEEGRVLYDGRPFFEMTLEEKRTIRQEIGMLFQSSALFDSMTVEDNVMFPMRMFTSMALEAMRERARVCLERVDIIGKEKLFPAELSGGMQKRVGIARAIALTPKYLFCDEPNSGLDPQTAILIDELIKELTEEYGTTTIVITHDMNSVMETGQNIMFIHDGQKWWQGDRQQLLDSSDQELNDFVFASDLMRQARRAITGRVQ
ncbi:MAG: ATP-binding cassette domain-containing protein [Flavobacteriales bacterium]|nr:ATP-binding cassette domain-containing protein [Flavobacteriales bacterium]MCB9193321.1 ATP-binding cassette domain-containing protein [Flavobacteriales bacterium]